MLRIVRRIVQSGYLTLVLSFLYALLMAWAAPGFATLANATNIVDAMLPLLIVATGQTIVLMTAGIDLSATAIIALTSVVGAWIVTGDDGLLAEHPAATPIAILCMLLVGSLVGLGNGMCIAWVKMPPFIVTLSTMMLVSGLSEWMTQSRSIYNLPDSFLFFGKNIGVAFAIAVVVAISGQLLLSRTWLGASLKHIGSNPATARTSGIQIERGILATYAISGCCAAIASLLITAQLETGSPVQWENNLLDIIGATVIGGTSLFGGRANVAWTACGVLLLTLIDNSLNLLNLSHFSIMMAKGGVILLAAWLDTLRNRWEQQ